MWCETGWGGKVNKDGGADNGQVQCDKVLTLKVTLLLPACHWCFLVLIDLIGFSTCATPPTPHALPPSMLALSLSLPLAIRNPRIMTHTHRLTHLCELIKNALFCVTFFPSFSLSLSLPLLLTLSLSAQSLYPPHKHRSFPLYWCINNFCALIESLCLCVRVSLPVCVCGCLGMCVTCISQINWSLVSHNIVEKTSRIFTPFALIYLLISCAAFFPAAAFVYI